LDEFFEEGVSVYLDDILIAPKTQEQNIELSRRVIRKLYREGFTAKRRKCEWGREKIEYLGYCIGNNKITINGTKLNKISEWGRLENVKELRSFLGKSNYLRKFIPNYSDLVSQLNDKLKNLPEKAKSRRRSKRVTLTWTKNELEKVETIIKILSNPRDLFYSSPTQQLVLKTDASNRAIGGILYQIKETGKETQQKQDLTKIDYNDENMAETI
jgi:RNase H-like domain found in reverse transcriptase